MSMLYQYFIQCAQYSMLIILLNSHIKYKYKFIYMLIVNYNLMINFFLFFLETNTKYTVDNYTNLILNSEFVKMPL